MTRRTKLSAALLIGLSLAGCGGEPPAGRDVAGRVLVEGAPLAHGAATFIPLAPTEGPRVVVPVREGRFEREAQRGPWPGEYRVEILATPPEELAIEQGRPPGQVSAEAWAAFRQIAPEFNRQSTLRVRIAESGPNELEFDVRWSPK